MDTLCICGRLADKIHCPHCGNATVYGLASRSDRATRDDGHVVSLRVFRCRRCCAIFNDDDWKLRCSAPAPRLGRRSVEQKAKLLTDILTPEAVAALSQANAVIPADKDFSDLSEKARMAKLNELLATVNK